MSRTVIVIGGGVLGLCSAYYLAKSGFKVTVLERGRLGHDCCSLGNAGMIVPSHFEPLAAPGMIGYGLRMLASRRSPFGFSLKDNPGLIRWSWLFSRHCNREHIESSARLLRDLNMASRGLYVELAKESAGGFALESNGLVMLCRTEKAFRQESKLAEHARDLDLETVILSAQEAKGLELNAKIDAAGAVHFRDDCHLNPNALMAWLETRVKELGVEIHYETGVKGFTREGANIKSVQTGSDEYSADGYVLSAGAYSGKLAKSVGIHLPMQGGKGYSVNLPWTSPLRHCYILVEARIAVTPMEGAIRFAGTMELGGEDLSVNTNRFRGIVDAIPQYLPDFEPKDFDGLGVWSGLRPCSADGLPYLGRSRSVKNLIYATGHSMMGVSMAAVSGKIVSQLANQDEPEFDIAKLDPERFS